jgi:peptidoglycan hydrolase-like protein with peptidoglycan-binding domain
MDPSNDARHGTGRLRRRRTLLIVVAGLAIAASAGGLLIATTIKSPAEVAAESAPPPLTQLTAPVRRQVITSTVQAQGIVTQPPEVSQLAGASGGGGGGGGASGVLPVVTKIFRPVGSTVEAGNVVVEVAGRPLFVLRGSVPAYRNLLFGESGTDVAQLQAGLETLGYSVGDDTDGVFGAGTASAVAAYYTALGYSVPKSQASPKAVKRPMVPLAEIMFVPDLPARVVKVAGPVGQEASGSLLTLSMGNPTVGGQLDPGNAPLVRAGMKVTIGDSATGLSRTGSLRSVGHQTATTGSISGGVYLPLKIIPHRRLPASMIGKDVTLTFTSAHTTGPVLAVPEAAIFARADGRIYLSKMTGARSDVQVPVKIDATGNGMVGVTPIDGGTLSAGDQVVTGVNNVRNPAAGQ